MENDWAVVRRPIKLWPPYMALKARHVGVYLRLGGERMDTPPLTEAQAKALRDLLNSGEQHGG